MPSDELHKADPISIKDLEGVSIHDALIFQDAIRGRIARLKSVQGQKIGKDVTELTALNVEISLYVSEETRKMEGLKA